jgi:hypothetical protein
MASSRGRSQAAGQTALIVVVPEVESLVGRFRALYDPASAVGVPAHVTVLYPFLPPRHLTTSVLRTLTDLFGQLASFRAKFARARRFPEVLYLAPSPSAPLRRLTQRVFALFPETPPYGGQFSNIVPHLTVAHATNSRRLAEIASEFAAAARDVLPVETAVREIVLIERKAGRWQRRMAFPLARRGSRVNSRRASQGMGRKFIV